MFLDGNFMFFLTSVLLGVWCLRRANHIARHEIYFNYNKKRITFFVVCGVLLLMIAAAIWRQTLSSVSSPTGP